MARIFMKVSIGPKTLVFPNPVFVVGTYDKNGKPNAMTAAWAGICCSEPPCVYVSLREATYSYANIQEHKAFTISIPSEKYIKEADYFGIASGRDEDKFSSAKLTPIKSDLVDAPYVKEFPFIVECVLFKSLKLGLHTQFIGEIKDVKVEDSVLTENVPDVEKIKPIMFNAANRAYYGFGKLLGTAFSVGKKGE
jgi:flavin reductase (DIM6/NTAB) family NADH-FMN oxidoreductase RutF